MARPGKSGHPGLSHSRVNDGSDGKPAQRNGRGQVVMRCILQTEELTVDTIDEGEEAKNGFKKENGKQERDT